MKRMLSIFLSVLTVFSITLGFDYLVPAETITNSVATVYSTAHLSQIKAGETLSVPVLIKDNPGILGFKLIFNYDADVLTPLSVECGDVISGGIQDNIEGDMMPGSINVYWAGYENLYDNGVLFYINFNVKIDATLQGFSIIEISYSQADTFDEDFNDVEFKCQEVWIAVIRSEQYQKWYNGQFNDSISVKKRRVQISLE